MITENCIEKWRRFGLLEGLSGESESRCAEVLEKTAVELIQQGIQGRTVEFLFPIIRRMAGEGFFPSDAVWLVEDFKEWMEVHGSHIGLCLAAEVDGADLCIQYSTECPKRYRWGNNDSGNS